MSIKTLSIATATLLVGIGMVGCAGGPNPGAGTKHDIVFKGIDVAKTDEAKKQILATNSVEVDGKEYAIGYHTLVKTGDKFGKEVFGLVKGFDGKPIKDEDGSPFVCRTSNKGSGPDHTTLLQAHGKLWSVTQFECGPGAMYISELKQDEKGKLSVVGTQAINQASEWGGFVHCAGIASPWGTHLGSEEYEPNAAMATKDGFVDTNGDGKIDSKDDTDYNTMYMYFGGDAKAKDAQTSANPYYYGWTPEVKILDEKGKTSYVKHYSMGRFAKELSYVMPDKKTVYQGDDGTNGALTMFIADKEADLSAGTLYAAKWMQNEDGSAKLKWVNLGHATDKFIRDFVARRPVFGDMFEKAEPNADGTCNKPFKSINTTWGHECLKLKSGMWKYASRLETRRYAAMEGATTEFRKKEGITFDPDAKKVYIAMSEIAKGMEKGAKEDKGGSDHIKLPKNSCGAVFASNIDNNASDNGGVKINSNYALKDMSIMVAGSEKKYSEPELSANKCDVDGLSNPDNITYLPGSNVLIIGEDTSGHQNDVMWAYNTKTKEMTRIFSTPYGSETTSPFWYPNINNFGYLMGVVQHPYGESDKDKAKDKKDIESTVGYFGPFPKLD